MSFYGYVTFFLVKKTRFEIFSKIVMIEKRSKHRLFQLLFRTYIIFSDFFFIQTRPTKIFFITRNLVSSLVSKNSKSKEYV